MEISRKAAAGRKNKGDIHITIEPAKSRKIVVESSIKTLYGDRIYADIEKELDRLKVDNIGILAEDDGALEYVIAARTEAAIAAATDNKIPPKISSRKVSVDPERLRRSRLYLPGNNPHLFTNARLFGADILLFDLEDSIPPAEKHATRYLVRNAIDSLDLGKSEISVRINPLSSPYGLDDLEVIVPAGPETIVLPKAESSDDVEKLKAEIARIQKEIGTDFDIGIIPLIESAKGVVNAPDIASVDGVIMLAFGAEDFTSDIGAERSREGKEQFVARCRVVLAAKAYGRMASDTVYSDLADEEGLIAGTIEARNLGFDGRGLIHPAQIEPVHEIFKPTDEQLLYAARVIAAAEEAEKTGAGVVAIGRKMIDPPVVARAKRQIALARKMGIQIPQPETSDE